MSSYALTLENIRIFELSIRDLSRSTMYWRSSFSTAFRSRYIKKGEQIGILHEPNM